MNLLINEHFLDTYQDKINVVQLIHLITDDTDTVRTEVEVSINSLFDLPPEAISEGEFEHAVIFDSQLYVSPDILPDIFNDMFPGDYDAVAQNIKNSLRDNPTGTLRLGHNGLVINEVQTAFDFPTIAALEEPVTVKTNAAITLEGNLSVSSHSQVRPSPEKVLQPEVATLGELRFNGRRIDVLHPTSSNGIVFDVEALYHAIYALQINQEFLHTLIVTAPAFEREDYYFHNNRLYLTVWGLAKVHADILDLVEWYPMVMSVVTQFNRDPHTDVNFDLLGDPVE